MSNQQTYISPDIAPRLAAIDIGSNSIRLVVAEAQAGGRYRVLDEERESTRLGRSLAATGQLDAKSRDDSLAALRRFQTIAAGLGIENLRAIATCAIREATNGPAFCQQVLNELGLAVEVISAQQEAHFAFHSASRRLDLADKNTLLVDIGGGSTEMVLASGELVEAIYATQLGAVRLSEKFDTSSPTANDNYEQMQKWIDRRLKKATDKPTAPLHLLIGSGGTFTALGNIILASRGQARLSVAGCRVSQAELRHLIDRLRKMSIKSRREVPGLPPDRADIFLPGLATIDRILRRFKINRLQIHPYGVRDGLLLTMIEQMQGTDPPDSPDQQAQIDRFATACGVELQYSRHAAKLCREIYEGLSEHFKLDRKDLRLLDAAARLQDVGYLIRYQQHHKHSYHLILHSRLEGFQPEELEIIANVARYHRGPEPKQKHKNFRRLSAKDRLRVQSMAAVLRLAGGLDRGHNQSVQSVSTRCEKNRVTLIVSAEEYPEVNLWAARRRSGLFQQIFEVELTVEWAGHSKNSAES